MFRYCDALGLYIEVLPRHLAGLGEARLSVAIRGSACRMTDVDLQRLPVKFAVHHYTSGAERIIHVSA
jgi:hypothetical protein